MWAQGLTPEAVWDGSPTYQPYRVGGHTRRFGKKQSLVSTLNPSLFSYTPSYAALTFMRPSRLFCSYKLIGAISVKSL